MYKILTLKDIILNNMDNIFETIVRIIDYKVFNEDKDMEQAFEETLEYLQTASSIYGISPNRKISKDLLELIRIRYENYKITKRLSK
jgi:hypothetical protein